MRLFLDHDWPGNVRELEHAIEHAFVLCGRDRIDVDDLPVELRHGSPPLSLAALRGSTGPAGSGRPPLTRAVLIEQLDSCGWNKAEVARRVGLSRTAIWKYMKKWNIPLQRQEMKSS
jgi:transcriptional regulator of acetoin/glycerol metabolism